MYNYEKELAREQFWMNGDEENWKISGFAEMPKKEIVEKAVQQMIQSMEESEKEGVKLESTHQMARIVLVLRMCNRVSNLKKIIGEYLNIWLVKNSCMLYRMR